MCSSAAPCSTCCWYSVHIIMCAESSPGGQGPISQKAALGVALGPTIVRVLSVVTRAGSGGLYESGAQVWMPELRGPGHMVLTPLPDVLPQCTLISLPLSGRWGCDIRGENPLMAPVKSVCHLPFSCQSFSPHVSSGSIIGSWTLDWTVECQ